MKLRALSMARCPTCMPASFTESLSYLERNTQISASQSVLGTMLGIKAMLMMEEGYLIPLEKVQTREEVIEKLQEFVVEFADIEGIGIFQHNYGAIADDLIARLGEALPELQVERVTYPPSLACHLGGNVLGVIVYEGTF